MTAAPLIMTAAQCAAYLTISRDTFRAMVADGQVPYVDMPGTMKRRFSRPQIDQWLADGCPHVSKSLAVAS